MIKNHIRTLTVIFIIIMLVLSVYGYITDFNITIDGITDNQNSVYEYTCIISEFPYEKNGYINAYAKIFSTDHPVNFKSYKVLFKVPSAYKTKIRYGNTIKLTGSIQSAHTSSNYGNFDYRNYLMSKNTVGICYISSATQIKQTFRNNGINTALYDFQEKINTNTEIYFKGDNLALIKSMLTGDRQDIDDNMRNAFQKSGIYHIVAVSGLHTGIFISMFAYILAMLPLKSRHKNYISKFGAILISILLLMFTGYGISITRVIFMSAIIALCFIAKREYNVLISIITAAIIIIFVTPYNLFNQSFLLSFSSTFGLCCALKIKQKFKSNGGFEYLKTSVTISLGSTIATAPFSSYIFGTVSLAGVLVNIVVIPLATLLLASIIIFSTLALILPQNIMSAIAIIPDITASLIVSIARYVSKFSFSVIEIQLYQTLSVLGIIAIIILILSAVIKKKYLYIIPVFVIIPCIILLSAKPIQKDTTVTFINCAKGECTLVKTPDGKNIMFDCGSSSYDKSFEDLFKPYFRHIRLNKIDRLYISYFDDEHINAVNKMIVNGYIKSIAIPPETLISNEKVKKNRLKITSTAKRYNIPITIVSENYVHIINKDIKVSVSGENFGLKNKNACAVYKIDINQTSFVLSSCLGSEGQKLLAGSDNCTVLKIPNYGNKVKATENYIVNSKPEYAVITAPENDRYNKVSKEITDLLKSNNITTYRTDINKTITFTTDGKKITSVKLKKG